MATWNSDGTDHGTNTNTGSIDYILTQAAAGDTITIPANTNKTWNNGIVINKAITISGLGSSTAGAQSAGTSTSTITRGASFTGNLITISGLPAANTAVTVQGIDFESNNNNNTSGSITISNESSTATFGFTNVRVTNCTFHFGNPAVFWRGWAYGVVDHCSFLNCFPALEFVGKQGDSGDIAWARNDYGAGTSNFPFVENCTITLDANFPGVPGNPWGLFTQEGGRWVCRYSLIDSSKNPNGGIEGPVDFHGNNNIWQGTSNDFRSSIRMEFYKNTIHLNSSSRVMDLRGGSQLIHDNTFLFDNSSPAICSFREEETDPKEPVCNPVRTSGWPAEDQIDASFIWNNTVNGVSNNNPSLDGTAADSTYIMPGRDYYLSAPSASTSTRYSPPGPPSLSTYPVNELNNLATTSYTAYTYPHPLVSAVAAPTVSSVSPTSGTTAGGTTVTVTGTGFFAGGGSSAVTGVTFGGLAGTSISCSLDTSLTVVSPSAAASTVPVVVTTTAGMSNNSVTYQFVSSASAPAITSISPTQGIITGGTVVTITGTNLQNVSNVLFGSVYAAQNTVSVNSAGTSVTVTAPQETVAGNVDVRAEILSPIVAGDVYKYRNIPSITMVSPSSGGTAGGTSVTLTGSEFTGATSVAFGATNGTGLTVNSDTSISITSPAESAGQVDVKVTTPIGTSVPATADKFTYTSGTNKAVLQSNSVGIGNSGGTTMSLKYAGAVTSGSLLAVATTLYDSSLTISNIKDSVNNTNFTQAVSHKPSGGSQNAAIYYFPNSASAAANTMNVTITYSGTVNSNSADMYIYEVSHCATSSPGDGTASSDGNSASPTSGNLTTANANDFILSAICTDSNVKTDGTGFEAGWTGTTVTSTGDGAEYELVTSTGTYHADYSTAASGVWSAVAAAFK